MRGQCRGAGRTLLFRDLGQEGKASGEAGKGEIMTPREIVCDTLEFKNTDHRTARELWTLPWAWDHYGEEIRALLAEYPSDFAGVGTALAQPPVCERGDSCALGEYTDAWGCKFVNIQQGIIGEVKEPLVLEDDWSDVDKIHIPEEWLSFEVEQVNRDIAKVRDHFVVMGCPRPFEQLQFIRGTENLFMDLMDRPKKMTAFMERMHDFYCRYLTKLAETDCDALSFMDDWGSQRALLINPSLWREIFRPMYRDFIDIARRRGKKTFMHSDGYTLEIIPDLIDIGLDAFNTQIFCMGPENLRQFRGKITFWGEIDRQNLLPYGSREDIRQAVRRAFENLYADGGCIAQCEFGPGGKPENVRTVFEEWENLTARG